LYEKPSSGIGEEHELFKEPGTRHSVTSWSHHGRFLLYHTENTPTTGNDVWALPLEGARKPVLLLGESFNEWAAQFSPDMRWIAYASTETGTAELFVRPFKVSAGRPALGDGKWQVSRGGGNLPRWRSDNDIFFTNIPAGLAVLTATVKTSGTVFESGVPQRLPLNLGIGWDVTPDGQRFLSAVPQVQRTAPVAINVVLNWPALLRK
jgi:hypothetical protein